MSIRGRSFLCAGLLICTSAQSIDNGVMPVEAYLRGDHKATTEEVGISGLLAYTADCGLAVYSTPDAAIRRAENLAIRLGSKSDEVSFSIDSNGLPDYIGRFVYAKGSGVKISSRYHSQAIINPTVFHVFDDMRWQLGSHCTRGQTHNLREWVQLIDLIADPRLHVGNVISVAGVFGVYGETWPALYLDGSAAAAGVDASAVTVACGKSQRFKDVCVSPQGHSGKYAIVVATVGLGKVRGSTSVVLEDVQSLELID